MQHAEKLRFARKVLGLTLRQVQDKTGVHNVTISQLETGKIKEPSFYTMMKLIKFYHLDAEDFLDGPEVDRDRKAGCQTDCIGEMHGCTPNCPDYTCKKE